jgi:hypothetical protein
MIIITITIYELFVLFLKFVTKFAKARSVFKILKEKYCVNNSAILISVHSQNNLVRVI